jgi:hypothetical protein
VSESQGGRSLISSRVPRKGGVGVGLGGEGAVWGGRMWASEGQSGARKVLVKVVARECSGAGSGGGSVVLGAVWQVGGT